MQERKDSGYVHTKPDKFENATFGVRKRNFLKTLSKVDKFENAGYVC